MKISLFPLGGELGRRACFVLFCFLGSINNEARPFPPPNCLYLSLLQFERPRKAETEQNMSKYRDTCCSALMVHDQLTALKEDLEEMDSILPIFRKHHDDGWDAITPIF